MLFWAAIKGIIAREKVMAKKRLAVEQIIQKLREAELELARGQTVPQVAKKLGVTEQTYKSTAVCERIKRNGSRSWSRRTRG